MAAADYAEPIATRVAAEMISRRTRGAERPKLGTIKTHEGPIGMKYGFLPVQWDAAVKEATAILRECARSASGTITYSDLAKRLRSITIGYHDPAMDHLLIQVSTEEHACGRPLLSVIVVHKYGDMEPGNGFYTLAQELGFDVSDREAFWIAEFKRVTDYWKSKSAG